MIAGEVCRGSFQELKLHPLFPGLPLELAQPRALLHGQRRFLAGMLTAAGAHPATEGTFVDTELLRRSYSAWANRGWQPGAVGEQLGEGVERVDAPFGGGGQVGVDDREVGESFQGAPAASG